MADDSPNAAPAAAAAPAADISGAFAAARALRVEIDAAELPDAEAAETFRIAYLGSKNRVKALMAAMRDIAPAQRRDYGQLVNAVKARAEERHAEALARFAEADRVVDARGLDLTRPGEPLAPGGRHPVNLVLDRIVDIFERLGFAVREDREIEDDWHNFTAMNTPADHPARDMQDTFYVRGPEALLLRTHTSSVQARAMTTQEPPIRIIAPGRVYRNETISARSHAQFHQVEGLYVDEDVSFADLKQTLLHYAREMYGPEARIRMRPSYFPFTEPSAEVDVWWGLGDEHAKRITKGTGWLEILGCGMVDPQVLINCGIDPEKYSGFAFGMGIERQAMLQYRITDIRTLFEGDVRFLGLLGGGFYGGFSSGGRFGWSPTAVGHHRNVPRPHHHPSSSPASPPMKPSTPKGTRDFLPPETRKRAHLFAVVREQFRRFGYAPIETPAMENLSTLTGKYGEEGDQLLFKVLNNGDFLAKADGDALDARDSARAIGSLARRGLRYDLTVPFARYVVQHRNELQLPFKRSCIAPVWRADRPQKGRYQEFYQCDADVVGSDSLVYEAELVQLFDRVFSALGLAAVIRVNHRGVLQGLLDVVGIPAAQFVDFVTALDKLDKIGLERVTSEMVDRGIEAGPAARALELLGHPELHRPDGPLCGSEAGRGAVADLRRVQALATGAPLQQALRFSPALARGLSYYTGCIFECEVDTAAPGQGSVRMGSIAAGGRYANLTEAFGGRDLSGVGISFGAERIYDVLDELDAWPDEVATGRQVLLAAFDEEDLPWAFAKTDELRSAGVAADCYPEAGKPKKPLRYADAEGIPYVALVGTRERAAGTLAVKHLASGKQEALTTEQLAARLLA